MLVERLTAQLLAGAPARDPVGVARRLLAIQAQDPRGARLAIRARTSGLTAADVDRALTVERSLVVDWLNRGTLHMVCSEDHAWLHALTTPPLFTASARRLAQEGVTPAAAERAMALIEQALSEDGPLTRRQLRDRLAGAGIRTEGQALVHLLFRACLQGIAVRGPMVGREQAYVLVRDWLGATPTPDRSKALAELARRYLTGHGPATDRDLARWTGLPLRDARAGLAAIAAELNEGCDGVVDLRGRRPARYLPPPRDLPPPRLLGSFEPVLLGWRSREAILGAHEARVVSGGLFRAFALVEGRAVATWRIHEDRVELTPFSALSATVDEALRGDADEVLRYLEGYGAAADATRPSALASRGTAR